MRAIYGGSNKYEPSDSGTARVVVPAASNPRPAEASPLGGSIESAATSVVGHIPTDGEVVFLWVGWNGGSTEIGLRIHAAATADFSSTYTFHHGAGTQRYKFWAATGRETDYPYAPGRSNRVRVTVSP